MGKYNFDEIIERRNTNSLKWHLKEGALPLWVADMDFRVAPEIIKAIKDRVDKGIYGYAYIEDEWKDSIIRWNKRRHNHTINSASLVFTLGGVPAFATILREFTKEGEKVLLLSPSYNAFYNVIRNNRRVVVESSLKLVNGVFTIDFDDFESKIKDEDVKLFILSNPHNPTGNIWSDSDLKRIAELAHKYNTLVISDEIHGDIVDPGLSYNPYAKVSKTARDESITIFSCSKAFNVAGIQTSISYADNPQILKRLKKAVNDDEIGEANVFSTLVTMPAYDKSEDWLLEVNKYIKGNKDFVHSWAKKNLTELKIYNHGATYLMWIDISAYLGKFKNSREFVRSLYNDTGLYVSDGMMYGEKDGEKYFRLNVASPRSRVEDGLNRLLTFIKANKG